MQEHLVRAGERRRSDTSNGVMTTSASPTLGGTSGLSLWWVEMAPGASGPLHAFDAEQLWSVVAGSATVTVDGTVLELSAGDTLVLPAGAPRQVRARSELHVAVCGAGTAVASVPGETGSRGVPPWIS